MKDNQASPFFSIITVCRNSEKTIEQTIQSVLNQSFKDFEYIIIDGASNDHTLEIINKYRDQIDTLVSEPDPGIYHAMNKGIALSSGKMIGIINSDDWYEPNTLELVAEQYEMSNGETIFHGLCKYYEEEREGPIHGYHHDVLKLHNIAHPTCFVPKIHYKTYGSFRTEYSISADYELLLRLYLNNVTFIRIERVLANFRMGGISARFRLIDEKADIHLQHNLITKSRYRVRKIRNIYRIINKKINEKVYNLFKFFFK